MPPNCNQDQHVIHNNPYFFEICVAKACILAFLARQNLLCSYENSFQVFIMKLFPLSYDTLMNFQQAVICMDLVDLITYVFQTFSVLTVHVCVLG